MDFTVVNINTTVHAAHTHTHTIFVYSQIFTFQLGLLCTYYSLFLFFYGKCFYEMHKWDRKYRWRKSMRHGHFFLLNIWKIQRWYNAGQWIDLGRYESHLLNQNHKSLNWILETIQTTLCILVDSSGDSFCGQFQLNITRKPCESRTLMILSKYFRFPTTADFWWIIKDLLTPVRNPHRAKPKSSNEHIYTGWQNAEIFISLQWINIASMPLWWR